MKPKAKHPQASAFTFVDLLAICAAVFICALIVLPALGRTHNQNSLTQSINNLRQLTSAWSMYSAQNNGRLVYSYPNYAANSNTWCKGSASSSGAPGSYVYGGTDPTGIESGDLWPYVGTLTPYKCPDDNRLATQMKTSYQNQPILRTYSMNCCLAGLLFGTTYDEVITSPGDVDNSNYKLFTKENQIPKPAGIFVFIEEDGASITDGMFFLSMSGLRFYDLPTRHHANGYPISFADGHVETYRFLDAASMTWIPGAPGGIHDWAAITNVATVPNP